MLIGYARTSTTDQVAGLEAQLRDLTAAGCTGMFQEQVSSVKIRPALDAAMASLNRGDVLVVTKPDRLARSTLDLLNIIATLESRGASLIVLSMGGERIDTRSPTGKLMLTMLGAIATFERDLMLDRQHEGIIKAKKAGKYKGRFPAVSLANRDSVNQMSEDGVSGYKIAKALGVSGRTIYRLLHETKPAETASFA